VVKRRGGYMLAELGAALLVAAVISISSIAVLARQAVSARMLYEERVAWEVACGRLARVEAGTLQRSPGRLEIPPTEPGWENLSGAACTLTVSSAEPASERVSVEVSWDGFRGGRRSVQVGTIVGRGP